MTSGLREIALSVLSEEQTEEFATWAFGKDYLNLNETIQFAECWNNLHGTLYHVDYMCGHSEKDMYEMIKLWQNKL